ncbi:CTQ-dependent glycine oxidase GoxA [Nisaea acidiphila]|uniref:CTQ-dependent glycine oxidase GoxA n=1 Tax=Nisaea acidiphila TaxID=1862145 RepID=A0A9J7APT7_9PROT|nr:CTQ-dependent glycine oxidase GoxA [Nisaea acidiphila]UUX48372.1 CTQ-dependent glycine oxidase GoxA [Nisaea acidiphila]
MGQKVERKNARGGGVRRRDFLAGGAAGMLAANLAWQPKAAVAAGHAKAAPEGAEIAKVRIYPAIGICRVGGSKEWFLAPEVPGLPPKPEGGFKDGDRRIKKQVQRFRVYAFDSQDRVIGELKDGDATISWSAHLVNAKAAWYGFNNPLDNGNLAPGLPGQKRNQYFTDNAERERMLVIDGGRKTISGAGVNPDGTEARYAFEGTFWGEEKVGLGDLRTDAEGRLLVVPPDGVSNSPTNAGITSFADNDGWHDDWCDGPVTATVQLANGITFEADPAWVACVGPNFAPDIPPISTMYDVISNLNVEERWAEAPEAPISFRKYIYPTFRRAALMEWLTDAANLRQGWLGEADFSDPAFIARLADPSEGNRAFRLSVFEKFRNPYNTTPDAFKEERLKIPYMMGDGVNYSGSPLQWFQFPKLQYDHLALWAEGKFFDDWKDAEADAVERLDDLPLEQRPQALTEAALEPCSGGAFHPGVELTYYLRLAPMYQRYTNDDAELFRLAHGDRPSIVQDLGFLLTPEIAFKGYKDTPPPIGPQMPGDLTRWMGLPWQCDAFSCQQVLMQENYPTAVWWPALLPIDVLPEVYYKELMNETLSTSERRKFFDSRVAWSRAVAGIGYHANGSYWDGITNMITLWERMGFVVKLPGPKDPKAPEGIPKEVYVEVGRADTMEFRFDWKPKDGMLPE